MLTIREKLLIKSIVSKILAHSEKEKGGSMYTTNGKLIFAYDDETRLELVRLVHMEY